MTEHPDTFPFRARRVRFRSLAAVVVAAWVLLAGHPDAQSSAAPGAPQSPSAPAARQEATAGRLPVRRVVLYKSGVGYFEHLGQVRGDQGVTIEFTSGQLNDVLKSLTALDLDGGRVTGVSYNSEASLGRRLGALRLPVGEQTTRAAFLTALRGARLEVRSGATRVSGRLLSVERQNRPAPGGTTTSDVISLVTDSGDLHTVVLDPGVTVRILEGDLNEEVGRYMSLVASVRDQDVRRLTISTAGTGARDLFVSYVSEVPVWKSTYRLVMPAAGESRPPLLQGWAVVDNTVGEDWERVELSLVAGAPQSFIQQISQPYYVQRPIVPLPERALMSPQTHQAGLAGLGQGAVTGTVTDSGGGSMPGVQVRLVRNGSQVGVSTTGADGRYRLSSVAPGQYDVTFTLSSFRPMTRSIAVSLGMESVLNVTMDVGSLSEEMAITAAAPAAPPPPAMSAPRGVVGGIAGGGRGGRGGGAGNFDSFVPVEARVDAAQAAMQAAAAGAELGDLFEYKLQEPVTIRRNQSSLVPIVSGSVGAEKVSLWTPAWPLGRPLRAVWLTNSTGLTLDGGSLSIVEGQAFAGEGLIEPLKAGEKRLVSYAMDLAMHVAAQGESSPARTTRVQIARGVLIHHTEEQQRRTYTARNEDALARVLVIEHPVRAGWTLGGDVKPAESTADWHRFRVTVAPKTTATFTVEESRPIQSRVNVRAVTDAQIGLWVQSRAIDAALEASLREVMTRQAAITRLNQQIATREGEIAAIGGDQNRVRENMRSLRGSAEERELLQRYVRQLNDQENRLEALRGEIQALRTEQAAAQAALEAFIEQLAAG